MEKIYMEENNNKNKREQRRQNLDFSVVLSFVVAIFAVVSIGAFAIASNQGNNVSYAAVTGDTFTMRMYTDDDTSNPHNYSSIVGRHGRDGTSFKVPLYYDSGSADADVVFCIQYGIDGVDNTAYQKDADHPIVDAGLLYILTHSYASGEVFTDIVGTDNKPFIPAEIFATQAAIWMYLDRHSTDTVDKLKPSGNDSLAALQQVDTLFLNGRNSIGSNSVDAHGIYEKIAGLVAAAENASVKKVNLVKENDEFVPSDDGKYYQTALITVIGSPADDLKSYGVALSGVDGAIAVSENGETLPESGIAPGTRFFVRIPVASVNEKATKLSVKVNGVFNSSVGNRYVAEGRQTVVVVTPGEEVVPGGLDIDLVGVPDTGINTAQTIYFIGLIVLLCGVGIVYANAKPVESKQ